MEIQAQYQQPYNSSILPRSGAGSSNSEEAPNERKGPYERTPSLQVNTVSMQVLPSPAVDGKTNQKLNGVPMFRTQLDPKWPDFDNLGENEALRKLKQERVFKTRHKVTLLLPLGQQREVFVKDLQRLGRILKAASTPRLYQIETPTSTIRRSRVHLTPGDTRKVLKRWRSSMLF